MPKAVDTKYESIFSREESLARAVGLAVVKVRPLSVWDVTIPIILILNYMRLKRDRELFIQNILFTKKMALEAALDIMKNCHNRGEVMSPIKDKTSGLIDTVKNGIYSEEIRQKQIKEIELLIDHYCKLLEAEGQDYDSLVKNAYQSQKNYIVFLEQLKGAEKEVSLAAEQTLGSKAVPEIAARIEEVTDRVRGAEVERIFRPNGWRQDAE